MSMEEMDLRAKVFLSCGQRTDDERGIASEVAEVLRGEGFETYIAVEEQTLLGLRENIFSHLDTSEYFLFIDFPRESLNGTKMHRGSLFSNQELAIASYLGLDVIAFQHEIVKPRDGMVYAMQLNPIRFKDPAQLPQLVIEQVKRSGWVPDWKNALRITRDPSEFDDASILNMPQRPLARYFHLRVENLHKSKAALNCVAYVDSIRDLEKDIPIPFRTAELKWAGYTLPTASIMPRSYRELDAFLVLADNPQRLLFNCFTDSGYFMRPIQGPGLFELTYVVISMNFPPSQITVRATLGNSLDDVSLVL